PGRDGEVPPSNPAAHRAAASLSRPWSPPRRRFPIPTPEPASPGVHSAAALRAHLTAAPEPTPPPSRFSFLVERTVQLDVMLTKQRTC
ncbi:unnamed protein product, partial [Urochloa humidicola]